MNKILRIGTRDSKLALVQTEIVAGLISEGGQDHRLAARRAAEIREMLRK